MKTTGSTCYNQPYWSNLDEEAKGQSMLTETDVKLMTEDAYKAAHGIVAVINSQPRTPPVDDIANIILDVLRRRWQQNDAEDKQALYDLMRQIGTPYPPQTAIPQPVYEPQTAAAPQPVAQQMQGLQGLAGSLGYKCTERHIEGPNNYVAWIADDQYVIVRDGNVQRIYLKDCVATCDTALPDKPYNP